MPTTTETAPPVALRDRLRAARRRSLKSVGKRLTRTLDRFYAAQSLVGDPPVFDNDRFPFPAPLEANWRHIHDEIRPLLEHREDIPPFHAISPDQKRISKGDRWRTFFLYGFGLKWERNCRRCPETVRLLEQVPELRTAWFSILEPGTRIPAHHGPTKGVIVFHLPLIVPREREKCWIRVDDHVHCWAPGRAFAFDDTYDHEVHNDTDEERVVLIFHANRPMRRPGRAVNRTFQAVIRRSAYVREPLRNLASWADRFDRAARAKSGDPGG